MEGEELVQLVDSYLDMVQEDWDELDDQEQKRVWVFLAECFHAGLIFGFFFDFWVLGKWHVPGTFLGFTLYNR